MKTVRRRDPKRQYRLPAMIKNWLPLWRANGLIIVFVLILSIARRNPLPPPSLHISVLTETMVLYACVYVHLKLCVRVLGGTFADSRALVQDRSTWK